MASEMTILNDDTPPNSQTSIALADAQDFWASVRDEIPMLSYMQTSLESWDGHSLCIAAPLAPNTNDKNTAFAGSLATLATVTGWATLTLWAKSQYVPCLVAAADSHIRYRKPVMSDFKAIAILPSAEDLAGLTARIASHGRGRVSVQVVVQSAGEDALTLEASYAVWPSEG